MRKFMKLTAVLLAVVVIITLTVVMLASLQPRDANPSDEEVWLRHEGWARDFRRYPTTDDLSQVTDIQVGPDGLKATVNVICMAPSIQAKDLECRRVTARVHSGKDDRKFQVLDSGEDRYYLLVFLEPEPVLVAIPVDRSQLDPRLFEVI